MDKIIYPKLSYKVMGILFEVHNKLGNKYQEKHYQQAVETKFITENLTYQKEAPAEVNFEDRKLGDFFVDFIVEDKIILELKKVWKITNSDIKQVLRYLDATNLKLGIIANFKYRKLEYRRVLNS